MNLEELRARLGPPPVLPGSLFQNSGDGTPLEQSVRGTVHSGPDGEYFAVETVRGAGDTHGRYSFATLLGAGTLRLPVVSGEIRSMDIELRNAAFIDTETTGLGYGVGTQVFMVGIGHLDGDSFRVRQFFLRHPGEEHAVLGAITKYLAPFTTLISYNGRSFDWPMLENRFIYQRMWSQPLEPAHVDLLYTARRLWKRRIDSCGLSSVEQKVLGVRRTDDDVEGWMIPQLYFRYLRTGDAQPLRRIFYHNAQDIHSLAMLSVHVHHIVGDPWAGMVEHPIDFISLASVYDRIGQADHAIRCLSHALGLGLPHRLETEALLRLGLINKRRGNWDEAVPLFTRVIERQGFERIACIELAKYNEHVARDHEVAMRYTVRAMRALDYPDFIRWPGTQRMELHHRHRRLQRRLAAKAA